MDKIDTKLAEAYNEKDFNLYILKRIEQIEEILTLLVEKLGGK